MKLTRDIALLLATVLALALMIDAWRTQRHDSQQLAATLTAQNAVIQQSGDREKQRDSQLALVLATIQSQKRTVQSPQQAAQNLLSVLPTLPFPISIHVPNLSVPPPSGESPSTALSIPQPDLLPLYDALQDCRANSAQADSLKKDLSDEKTRSAALQQERNAAIKVARGGTFLTRLKRSAKWFALGLATGAAVSALTHH